MAAPLAGLGENAQRQAVPGADQPHLLARHIATAADRALQAIRTPEERVALANAVIALLAQPDELVTPPEQLLSIRGAGPRGHDLPRPATPLTEAALLTNARNEPSIGSELRSEMESADEVHLLCAFVKWHGLRVLEAELRRLAMRGCALKVITTTYMGATERQAIDRLVREFGAEVKIHYDTERTRLHAKAWLFSRRTGFDTAYIGSSNLSRAALLDGVEWNVRLSPSSTPTLLRKFRATFDSYWNDPTFEPYDPDLDRDRLDDALGRAGGPARTPSLDLSGLEVRPYAFQQSMLDALAAERALHDRHRNLVVAATGTGKTVVAALDYQRLITDGRRPSLLFVAHRREILQQSLRTYREVLRDGSFGELWEGGQRPERWEHVFATVQSMSRYGADAIPPNAFEVVVIDEFHHAEAATYRRILDHLSPRELLGLTATPERTDGGDVRTYFGNRTAYELRLWDALEQDLLSPFHYFGIADNTDLSRLAWTRGRYDEAALANLYTGNDARAALILEQVRLKISDPLRMRALGFCVGVGHARYMADRFSRSGIPSLAVTGESSPDDRRHALDALRAGELNALFTADLFNEGLDIPDVDTVLFLRPTESSTIFLQQLGRGLRRSSTKAVLTALDFVGHHRSEFRFDQRFRALTGFSRTRLEHEVEHGFPFLPSGTQIVLDVQTQRAVLGNLRSRLPTKTPQLTAEVRTHPNAGLPGFLQATGLSLADILRPNRSWTSLRRKAGVEQRPAGPAEAALVKRGRKLAHVDDPLRADVYQRLLGPGAPAYGDLSAVEQSVARMLYFGLFPRGGPAKDYTVDLQAVAHEIVAAEELADIVAIAFDETRRAPTPLSGVGPSVPLVPHGRYQREEALAALSWATLERTPASFMEGVLYQRDLNVDALFVTVRKSEADFSPTTMYRDFPISRELFHWESQSVTSLASPTGQRYVNGTSTVLLFVRESSQGAFGTAPYTYLGPATHVAHEGERPIAITWRLHTPMPSDLYVATSAAVA
ncbi:DUF3427 domain-containing protein [Cellulomonas sp. DKR-3]|uniref:DUF3427 domain-containing protein n=2 Tax=Cellulomonas fulva TaxID=2835530 RepID=A0ABS5U295_9CELL|nr:DUF3427 domain-containing protein [Cellulomonas fulva]